MLVRQKPLAAVSRKNSGQRLVVSLLVPPKATRRSSNDTLGMRVTAAPSSSRPPRAGRPTGGDRTMPGFDTNEAVGVATRPLAAGERGLGDVFSAHVADPLIRGVNSGEPVPGPFPPFPDATVVLDASRATPAANGASEDPEAS